MRQRKIEWALAGVILAFALLQSCKPKNQVEQEVVKDEHEMLNEDSLELAMAYEAQAKITASVQAFVETEPVEANSEDDAADDPAIWYNAQDPTKSIVYGSNKKGGLVATDLKGSTIKYYPLGSVNNVDILYDFTIDAKKVTLLGCSNRTTQAIDLFEILPDGELQAFNDPTFKMDTTRVDDIYGFCFGRDIKTDSPYVFINGKNGLMQQYLIQNQAKKLKLDLVREVQFDSQTEGMVADNKRGKLYVGEEGAGVWMLDIDPSSEAKDFVALSGSKNPNISFDIEGLTLYDDGDRALLLVSSQGNFSYAIYDVLSSNKYLGSFKISDRDPIDGVEETDGIDIVTDSLGVDYPHGIFVAQDGFNYENDTIVAQNFKYFNAIEILRLVDNFEQANQ